MVLLLFIVGVEKPKIFLLLQECLGLKSRYRRFVHPVHLELCAFYLAYSGACLFAHGAWVAWRVDGWG